jgi:hypothetical protein
LPPERSFTASAFAPAFAARFGADFDLSGDLGGLLGRDVPLAFDFALLISVYRFFDAAPFWATAAFTSVLNARALTFSPS